MRRLVGIWGQPYVDLAPFIDTACFPALDREITLSLARIETPYTGGTLKWMGVTAPWHEDDGYADVMHLVSQLSREDWDDFVSLAEEPGSVDGALRWEQRREYTFGDETDHPLTLPQMKWLKYRLGAYFPWKVCYHLLENDRWEDKHRAFTGGAHTGHRGEKHFGEEALALFPQTVDFVRSLPFSEIGRVVLFGVEANDHAPYHRDSEPGRALAVAQSINFDPRGTKGLALKADEESEPVLTASKIYWFNDMDWHGVEPAPYFRYSLRVDGVFVPSFLRDVERAQHPAHRPGSRK